MVDAVWDDWAKKVSERLQARSTSTLDGCLLWKGAVTRRGPGAPAYGISRLKLPYSSRRKIMRAHILAYLVANIPVRSQILSPRRTFDISHLCHQSLCISVAHLSAESRTVNNSRIQCNVLKTCLGHGDYNDCIFPNST